MECVLGRYDWCTPRNRHVQAGMRRRSWCRLAIRQRLQSSSRATRGPHDSNMHVPISVTNQSRQAMEYELCDLRKHSRHPRWRTATSRAARPIRQSLQRQHPTPTLSTEIIFSPRTTTGDTIGLCATMLHLRLYAPSVSPRCSDDHRRSLCGRTPNYIPTDAL